MTTGASVRRRRRHRRGRHRGRARRAAARAGGRQGDDRRGGSARRARHGRHAVLRRAGQGARVRVPEHALRAAPAFRQPRCVLRAGGPAEIREHLPAPGRRHHVALARHVPAPRARRLSPGERLRARHRLAARVRRARAVVRGRRERDRRGRRLGGGPGLAAHEALSDARDCDVVRRPARRAGVRRHALPGARDAAGPQLGRARRPAALLRQQQLHSDLPHPGQVRRDRAPGPRRGGRRPPAAAIGGARDRRRAGSEDHRHPLQASGRIGVAPDGEGVRARRACDGNPETAADVAGRRTPPAASRIRATRWVAT